MHKNRWLTVIGVVCLVVAILIGVPIIIEINEFYGIMFVIMGITLSLIVIGLGEILHYLDILVKGSKNNETNEENIKQNAIDSDRNEDSDINTPHSN